MQILTLIQSMIYTHIYIYIDKYCISIRSTYVYYTTFLMPVCSLLLFLHYLFYMRVHQSRNEWREYVSWRRYRIFPWTFRILFLFIFYSHLRGCRTMASVRRISEKACVCPWERERENARYLLQSDVML